MEDPRSLGVLSMAVSLIASGAPEYAHRSAASVAAELVGVADDIDDTLLGPPCEGCPDCDKPESVH